MIKLNKEKNVITDAIKAMEEYEPPLYHCKKCDKGFYPSFEGFRGILCGNCAMEFAPKLDKLIAEFVGEQKT